MNEQAAKKDGPEEDNQLQQDNYQVNLPVFDGPLDLLLHLVKKDKLDIYDIPIAQITEQYFSYLELMETLNLDIAGDYLVMAATLTQIKSKMLLPIEETSEEETEVGDPRQELVKRLLEYQRFKDAALQLANRDQLNHEVFTRQGSAADVEAEATSLEVESSDIFHLLQAFQGVLERLPKDKAHQVAEEEVTVREKIVLLLDLFKEQEKIAFGSLFAEEKSRISAIALFLALLECIKMHFLKVEQNDLFSEIEIIRTENFNNEELIDDAKRTVESDM